MRSNVVCLPAVNVGGRFMKMAALRLARTRRTTTWRDLNVVRAIDEKWGA